MQTTLHLLTTDGAVFLVFRPALSPEQYAELLEMANAAIYARELELALVRWSFAQELEMEFSL